MKKFIVSLILLCVVLTSGCGTFIYRAFDDIPVENKDGIYPVTKREVIGLGYSVKETATGNLRGIPYFCFLVIDLPFSIVFDTILIPYDLIYNTEYEQEETSE